MPNLALATTIIALILALTVGMQVVELATANPVPWPSTPNQDKPTLTIESPQNNTAINDGSVYLNFTVTKPDSWNDPQWFMPYIGQIGSVNAYFDGNPIDFGLSNSEGYSVKLNLNQSASGIHTLNVTVLSHTYYRGPAYNGSHILHSTTSSSGSVYEYPLIVSDIVYFTVEQQTPIQSAIATGSDYLLNQTNLILIAIVIAIVAVALLSLVHFKRHKSNPILVKKP
jgi:hypothetical protein